MCGRGVLQCVAVCCKCYVTKYISACMLHVRSWCVAVCCSVLQCVAVCCAPCSNAIRLKVSSSASCMRSRGVLQCVPCVAVCCSVLQCVVHRVRKLYDSKCPCLHVACAGSDRTELAAPRTCSVLQCVAVCCSVLQCVAVL